ncbi:hypothetical protein AMEX_G1789 [Astyanax mexicanus]|uniref:Uncharacterized protein n=1 Tax=Astyanax mexicanus TaxID=7994 RepID=A0A8T2MHI6_ASTMX|nr:hypothetical protein AMEX_G1789 [Astyanax mexicanus]
MLKLTRTGLWDLEFGNPQETWPAGEITVIGILLLVMSSLFVCLEHQLTSKTSTPISQKLIPVLSIHSPEPIGDAADWLD